MSEDADTAIVRPWVYREGYHQLRGDGSWSEWAPKYRGLFEQLAPFQDRRTQPAVRPRQEWDELEALWAVSILSDAWIAEAQDVTPAGDPWAAINGAALTSGDAFLADIGLDRFDAAGAFSPFHHEIVEVITDDTVSTAIVEESLWPGFWFGDLLFRRAGVRLRAPAELIDPVTATTSALYFCNWREPRKAHDLSHGWGYNSSWRTDFHLFYADGGGFHFNWGAETYLSDDLWTSEEIELGPIALPPSLRSLAQVHPAATAGYPWEPEEERDPPLDQRRELLINRSFVGPLLPADHDDRWVWEDRISLRQSRWPLEPNDVLDDPGTDEQGTDVSTNALA